MNIESITQDCRFELPLEVQLTGLERSFALLGSTEALLTDDECRLIEIWFDKLCAKLGISAEINYPRKGARCVRVFETAHVQKVLSSNPAFRNEADYEGFDAFAALRLECSILCAKAITLMQIQVGKASADWWRLRLGLGDLSQELVDEAAGVARRSVDAEKLPF